jgi:PAS domain S-box-containing protein
MLADHSLPQFTAMEALQILKDENIDTPFILITGTVSEEFAVNAMREGAWDYMLKDRLQRLPNAIIGAYERYNTERERRKYLDAVIEKEALMKEAEQLAHFGSWYMNLETGVRVWSDEKYRILGYSIGEVKPTEENFLARVHPDDYEYIKELRKHAFLNLNSLTYECRIVTGPDEEKRIYAELIISRNVLGDLTHVYGFIRDVTASWAARKKLEESERKYKYLFDYSPRPTLVLDLDTLRFLDVNRAAVQAYGYTYEEFVSLSAADIRPESEVQPFKEFMEASDGSTISYIGVWKHCRKDGTIMNVKIHAGDVVFDSRPARLVIITDIS